MENNTTTPATEEVPSEPVTQAVVVFEPEKVTAPDAVNLKLEREVAYVIKDAYFGEFEVVKSDNAWWMDRLKVEKLIDAFKSGHIAKAARFYAGITDNQWKYFLHIHPDFSAIKADLEEVQMFKAMNTINASLEDPKTARWFLDRRHPKFASKVRVETDEPLQSTINNNLSIGNININAGEVSAALREIARSVLGTDEEDSRAIADEALEVVATEESK